MTERTYLVGLPVAVSVYDGRVHLEVDAAELSVAVRDSDDDAYSDDERESDVRSIAAAFTALVEQRQGWRITASTMQHVRARARVRRRWLAR